MELIKIYNGSLVNARELHGFLEIKVRFNDWVSRTLINQFKEEKDFYSELSKSTGGRPSKEYYLTLDTAKKLAMMAKTSKGEEARNYFLECEKMIVSLKKNKRLEAFLKLESTKERLQKNILDIGGIESDFLQIDFEGRRVFFNNEPIPDEELPRILLLSRDLATEITNTHLERDEHNLQSAMELNKDNHLAIRDTLIDKGIKPEDLPQEEKLKRLGE